MPLVKIPRNTYPDTPTGYAAYWRASSSAPFGLHLGGKVPLWVTYHDGGPKGRYQHVIIVRVCPDLEVVLVSAFSGEIILEKIEDAIKKRRSKARWPERLWWISHVVYLASPPKRKPKKPLRDFNFKRFCLGRLMCSDRRARMLAFIPVSRLKVNVVPIAVSKASNSDTDPHLRFEVDASNQQQRSLRSFVTKLADLERWEQKLVKRALGHLLGRGFTDVLIQAPEQIAGGDFTNTQQRLIESQHSALKAKAEDFRPVRWLGQPESKEIRHIRAIWITITRFPMGGGPDPEMSVRPWIPPELCRIFAPLVPIDPYVNLGFQLEPDPKSHSVMIRLVIGPLIEYGQR